MRNVADRKPHPPQERRQFAPLVQAYGAAIAAGQLRSDPAQAEVAALLGGLQLAWGRGAEKRLLGRLLGRRKGDRNAVQGVYLWGGVGRGKSLLMDMFFDTAQIAPKRRVHFHAFMLDVHARIHRWREENRSNAKKSDPIPPLADVLAHEARLLCLDEFQVTDVADAMILGRLFSALFERGVRVVFTSNRKPDDLYLHGLQRDRFVKFIELIYQKLSVVELQSAEDYRLSQLKALHDTFIVAPAKEAQARMDAAFSCLIHGAEAKTAVFDVQGHALHIPAYWGDVARFSFADLCEKPLGAADYLTLAQTFGTVLLGTIPQLSPEKRNEAKRFVTLIDTLYEHKVKLIASAEVPPEQLYSSGDGSFEFARTVSRLVEMQSETYLAASHRLP